MQERIEAGNETKLVIDQLVSVLTHQGLATHLTLNGAIFGLKLATEAWEASDLFKVSSRPESAFGN
jgi:hypothetical protein